MRYTIETRQNRKGNWWCNGTIEGYDYSFEGPDIYSAQALMIELLNKKNLEPEEQHWEAPKEYPWKSKSNYQPGRKLVGYAKSRSDNNPQG